MLAEKPSVQLDRPRSEASSLGDPSIGVVPESDLGPSGIGPLDTHTLEIHQNGEVLQLDADRAVPVAEGSYRWQGELRLWDNEALIGWYHSTDAAVRSKGTLYLSLQPHGDCAWGRWVGMSYDGPVVSGLGSIARTEELATQVIRDHLGKDGQ